MIITSIEVIENVTDLNIDVNETITEIIIYEGAEAVQELRNELGLIDQNYKLLYEISKL